MTPDRQINLTWKRTLVAVDFANIWELDQLTKRKFINPKLK